MWCLSIKRRPPTKKGQIRHRGVLTIDKEVFERCVIKPK
jgi:hypothetical protein